MRLPTFYCYCLWLSLLLFGRVGQALAQSAAQKDSLRKLTTESNPLKVRSDNLNLLCFAYVVSNPDTAMYYGKLALATAQAAGYPTGAVKALNGIAAVYSATDHPDQSLALMQQAIDLAEEKKLYGMLYNSFGNLGTLYVETGDYAKGKDCYLQSLQSAKDNHIENANLGDYNVNLGDTYLHLHQEDSAIYYVDRGYQLFVKYHATDNYFEAFMAYGDIYAQRGQPQRALQYYRQTIDAVKHLDDFLATGTTLFKMAKLLDENGQPDSASYYARESLRLATLTRSASNAADAAAYMSRFYKSKGRQDSAFKYAEILLAAKDSLYDQEKLKRLKDLEFTEHSRQQELAAQRTALKNRVKFYGLGLMALLFLGGLVFLWRNNRQKQKANQILQKTLRELKSTQALLVQQEKMASLGELTAGIAHEIQNPLNFVNNFSELNAEQMDELLTETEQGNLGEVKLIASDVKENAQKINMHGKRAGAIVKAMLEHARPSSGKKEPTDLNALIQEYLGLAYQGAQAKDKNLQVQINTDFDPHIKPLPLMASDIGRVLLNIFNNGFYAIQARKDKDSNGHTPALWVTTQQTGKQITVIIKDNGSGMASTVLEKIFQPFFTTKPTGQGTGLGLSLAYDIIKAHGGALTATSTLGEGSSFIIQLEIP